MDPRREKESVESMERCTDAGRVKEALASADADGWIRGWKKEFGESMERYNYGVKERSADAERWICWLLDDS